MVWLFINSRIRQFFIDDRQNIDGLEEGGHFAGAELKCVEIDAVCE